MMFSAPDGIQRGQAVQIFRVDIAIQERATIVALPHPLIMRGLSAQMSITAKWLNFMKLSQSGADDTARRMLSVRNAASSWAIPIKPIYQQAWSNGRT